MSIIEVPCVVCEKLFKKDVPWEDGERFVPANMREMTCSPKCAQILDEALANESNICWRCKKKAINPRTFALDLENKVLEPLCEKCEKTSRLSRRKEKNYKSKESAQEHDN